MDVRPPIRRWRKSRGRHGRECETNTVEGVGTYGVGRECCGWQTLRVAMWLVTKNSSSCASTQWLSRMALFFVNAICVVGGV